MKKDLEILKKASANAGHIKAVSVSINAMLSRGEVKKAVEKWLETTFEMKDFVLSYSKIRDKENGTETHKWLKKMFASLEKEKTDILSVIRNGEFNAEPFKEIETNNTFVDTLDAFFKGFCTICQNAGDEYAFMYSCKLYKTSF